MEKYRCDYSLFENFTLGLSDVTYSWPDKITPESGKRLPNAIGLPMSKTYRLRFEILFRPDDRSSHRTIFQGTDGGSFSSVRCGGRLPGIWTKAAKFPDLSLIFK